jgi:alpha-tubulin suppressor-like RCC1 family protein
MQKPMNLSKKKIIKSLLVIITYTLSACDSSPIEQVKSLTADKYPVANMPDEPLETPLEINIEPKRLAMTSSWSAGVKDDGTLWTWGTDGLLRETKTGQDPTPRQVEGVNDAVAVSGAGHMLLLKDDGTVWGWGSNYHGEIDPSDGDIFIEELRQIKGIENVVDIAAGEMDSIFLTNNGEVYVLGSNEGGWVNEIPKQLIIPTKVPNLSDIIRIEFRNGVLLALDKKGELYSTGKSERALGRLLYQSQEPEIEYHPAAKVALPKKTIDFSVTSTSAMAVLEDGSVWNWGSNSSDNLALSDSEDIKMPEKNPYLHKVVNIGIHAAVTSQGDLYTWSKYGFGKNKNSISAYTYNKPFLIMQNIDPDQIVYGYLSYAVVTNDGNVWFWNWNENGQRGTGEVVESMEKDYVLTPEKSLFTLN